MKKKALFVYNCMMDFNKKEMFLESLILIFIFTLVEEKFDIQCPYMNLERLILIIFIFTMSEEKYYQN